MATLNPITTLKDLRALLVDTSGTLYVDIAKIANATYGLAALKTLIDTVDTNVDAILVDTGTTLPATLSGIETKVDTVDGIVDAITAANGAITIANSSYDYLDAGAEQTILEVANASAKTRHINCIHLDTTAMTQANFIVNVYTKLADTNYHLAWTSGALAATVNAVLLPYPLITNSDFKITITEGGDEGETRAIAYFVSYRTCS